MSGNFTLPESELTDEQKQQVERLIRIYYVNGITDSVNHMTEVFKNLTVNAEHLRAALHGLVDYAEDVYKEVKKEEGTDE